jgi:ankyrin repeat protein
MKGFTKFFVIFTVLYLAVWFTLSGTEAGILTLQIGVKQNNSFLTRVFIALGADPKDTGQEGMSALHFAGYLGADQVIPLLIEKGAPINSLDEQGRTPLHLAAYSGQTSAVSVLMDHKADPEVKDKENEMTALHYAVTQKHGNTVKVLLEKGANPNPEEKNTYTPLFIAKQEGLDDIVTILQEHDAH